MRAQLVQEGEQLGLRLAHVVGETRVPVEGVQAGGTLTVEALAHPRAGSFGPAQSPAQNAAGMLGELLHLRQIQTVTTHQCVRGDGGEIAEAVVADGVEPGVVEQRSDTGIIHFDDPVIGEQNGHALGEAVRIGDVRQHVIDNDDVRAQPLGGQRPGEPGVEELRAGRHADRAGGGREPG